MMPDNPNFKKIYESIRTGMYVWVIKDDKPKRVKITNIDWIPNPNNSSHPCAIYTGKTSPATKQLNIFSAPRYEYKEIYLSKEKCVTVIRKDLKARLKAFTKNSKAVIADLNGKLKALQD